MSNSFAPEKQDRKGANFHNGMPRGHIGSKIVTMRSACLLAGALLISAPFSAISAPRDDKGDALRTIASRVGRSLGAASVCPGIAPPRVKGISDKLTAVITSSSPSEDESRSVLELFNASYGEGARGVNARQIDCATADRELADLEKVSGPSSQMSAAATIAQPTTFATQLAAGPIHGSPTVKSGSAHRCR